MKLTILFIFFLLSCSEDRFSRVETLSGFRILGIRADNPEVSPGGSANLQLLVSDVDGGGRVINGNYEACIDPGISIGASVSCDHDPGKVTGASVIDTTQPDLATNLSTGYSGAVTVTVPAGIFLGRSSRDQFNGVGYIVIFKFTVDGKTISSFKRIIATNRGSFNTNPSGSAVTLNGAPLGRIPDKDDELNVTTSAPETYDYQNVDGSTETKTEEVQIAWYVSVGEFDKPKSDLGEKVTYLTDAPASLLLLSVVRDDRGGLDVVRIFQ